MNWLPGQLCININSLRLRVNYMQDRVTRTGDSRNLPPRHRNTAEMIPIQKQIPDTPIIIINIIIITSCNLYTHTQECLVVVTNVTCMSLTRISIVENRTCGSSYNGQANTTPCTLKVLTRVSTTKHDKS